MKKSHHKTYKIKVRHLTTHKPQKPRLEQILASQREWRKYLEDVERDLELEELTKKRETQYAINILIHTVILVLAGIGLFYLISLI